MTLSVLFSNRDFTPMLQPFCRPVPTELHWSSPGGPQSAVIELRDFKISPLTFQALLRTPVLIRDGWGRSVWWGFVSGLLLPNGSTSILIDVNAMANRVGVLYTAARPGAADPGLSTQTSWSDALDSQAVYGVKDRLIQAGSLSLAQVNQRQALELGRSKWPVGSLLLPSSSVQSVKPELLGQKSVDSPTLLCSGWYSSLSWRHYSSLAGQDGCSTLGTGVQALGNNVAYSILAQQFALYSSWSVERIGIRVKKVAAPTDNLCFDIAPDSSGFPSGSPISGTIVVPAASLSATDYTWLDCPLSPLLALTQSTNYWLRVYRSTYPTVDAVNYYSIDVDEGLGYAPGVLKIWDGSAWQPRTPNADMNFRLKGSQETTVQLAAMAAFAGQFLAGVVIEAPSSVYASQYRDGLHTCLEEITRILDTGTSGGVRLLAEVTADRVLRVYTQPAAGSADWLVDSAGVYYNEIGNRMPPYMPPCGRWVRLKEKALQPVQLSGDPAVAWVSSASWKASDGY